MPEGTTEHGLRLPRPGIGLCLSGGGFRAMLFHLGTLWRLNELGMLTKIDRISSVSGGTITAGYLWLKWDSLDFDPRTNVAANFKDAVVPGLRGLAGQTIDVSSGLKGFFSPFSSISEQIRIAYDKRLFANTSLQDLSTSGPRFVINASNLQSGALWRFSKTYMRDWKVGEVTAPKVRLSEAVAASSAFPPVLSPAKLKLSPSNFKPGSSGKVLSDQFQRTIYLSDGGVYDNLGLEPVYKRYDTVLVSDAGMAFSEVAKVPTNWFGHLLRVLNTVDNQVRSLRKRDLIESYKLRNKLLDSGFSPDDWVVRHQSRSGAYWGIATPIGDYRNNNGDPLPDALVAPEDKTDELARVKTRLAKMDSDLQERLINWGYASCDASLRANYDEMLPAPAAYPYEIGVG